MIDAHMKRLFNISLVEATFLLRAGRFPGNRGRLSMGSAGQMIKADGK